MPKFILPGSIEVENGTVTCAVFEGKTEWDINKSLRYVQFTLDEFSKSSTVLEVAEKVYNNSTGSVINGDFERT